MIPLPLAMVFCVLFFPCTMCWFVKISNQSSVEMRRIVDNLSTKYQGISFHLRDEQTLYSSGGGRVRAGCRNYIEGV